MAETAGVQEYLESMYRLTDAGTGQPVSTSALAESMSVSPASVSEMLKRLAGLGLVEHRPYAGARLTAKGAREAAQVVRYHRLWERFMVDLLGMSWDQVHDEACRLEHATTPLVADRLSQLLNNPATCPHGNPMPDATAAEHRSGAADGTPLSGRPSDASSVETTHGTRAMHLIDVPQGCDGVIHSVSEDAELLRYCLSQDVLPGARFRVVAVHPVEQLVEIEIYDLPVSLRSRAPRIKVTSPRRLMVGPRIGQSVIVSCADGATGRLPPDSHSTVLAQTTDRSPGGVD